MHPAQMLQAMQDVARGKKVPSFMTRLKKFRAGYKVRSNPAPVPHDNRAAGTTLEPDDQKNTQQSLQTIAPNPHSRPQRPRIRIPLIARNSSPSTETCVHDGGCESPLESYPTTLVGSPASWSPKTASRSSLLTLDSPEEKKALQPPTSPEDLEASEEDDGARDERQWRDERSRPIARNDHGEGAPSCVTNPRPSPLSLVDLAPSSTPPRPAPLHALQGALGETVWYMIGSQLDQHDLTRFAMICSETLLAAESLIHRHPAIRDEDTMVAWAAALERNSDRAHLVQSLTVGWDTEEDVKGDAAIAFAAAIELLRASKNLHTLNVFATATAGNFGSGHILPASVRTLNTSGAFFSRVEQPLPFLRHLSIRVEANDLNKLRTPISLCRETLIQLRICLKWPSPMRKREDNPVRLCSHLDAPNLVYLELHEERSENIPLVITKSRWDRLPVGTSWSRMLATRMPNLRYLVWRPVWAEGARDMLPGGAYDDIFHSYPTNVFALLRCLRIFAFALPDNQYLCFEGGAENSRDSHPQAETICLWKTMRERDRRLQL